MSLGSRCAVLCLCSWLAPVASVASDGAAPLPHAVARFVLIVGVNASDTDPELDPLRYADDDAARWFELWRLLGARAYLLMSPDRDTARVHTQAAAEAAPATRAQLKAMVSAMRQDVAVARARGVTTEVYFIYAGHGNRDDDGGYLTLEDARLSPAAVFEEIIRAAAADRSHVIVDACYSYFLALDRGPGGHRRSLTGFVELERVATRGDVGLLLSTSTTSRSHEWEAFQAGVFSHEVRSGLTGAADADRDGVVSYLEIAAFVERANAPIPNERYRPKVYARAPSGSEVFADLRTALGRKLEVPGDKSGRYYLEDARGVRVADLHNAAGTAVDLRLPPGRLFLHDVERKLERGLPPDDANLELGRLEATAASTRDRGAEHALFHLLFSEGFDQAAVAAYTPPTLVEIADRVAEHERAPPPSPYTSPLFIGGAATSGAGALVAVGTLGGATYASYLLGTELDRIEYQQWRTIRDTFVTVGLVASLVAATGAAVSAAPILAAPLE